MAREQVQFAAVVVVAVAVAVGDCGMLDRVVASAAAVRQMVAALRLLDDPWNGEMGSDLRVRSSHAFARICKRCLT